MKQSQMNQSMLGKIYPFFFFCGIFDAREDTAVRVSSRRTVVPNYFSVLVFWEILQRLTCSRASEAYIIKRRRNSKMLFRLSQSF